MGTLASSARSMSPVEICRAYGIPSCSASASSTASSLTRPMRTRISPSRPPLSRCTASASSTCPGVTPNLATRISPIRRCPSFPEERLPWAARDAPPGVMPSAGLVAIASITTLRFRLRRIDAAQQGALDLTLGYVERFHRAAHGFAFRPAQLRYFLGTLDDRGGEKNQEVGFLRPLAAELEQPPQHRDIPQQRDLALAHDHVVANQTADHGGLSVLDQHRGGGRPFVRDDAERDGSDRLRLARHARNLLEHVEFDQVALKDLRGESQRD